MPPRVRLGERERVWSLQEYPIRAKVEITIPGWPRRQRFGRITAHIPFHEGDIRPYLFRVAFPKRFKMTNRACRDMGGMDVVDGLEAEKALPLCDERMAHLSNEVIRNFGIDFYYTQLEVVGPPLPGVQPVARRAVRLGESKLDRELPYD